MNEETGEEQILLVIHKHWVSFLQDVIYVILPAFAALALLLVVSGLPQFGIYAGVHVIAAILFPLCLLGVIIMATILWSNYFLNMMVVTDRSIFSVVQTGWGKRDVLGWNIDDIQRANARQEGFLETFFNVGAVLLMSNGIEVAHIEGIPNPEYVCAVILKQDERYGQLKETARRQVELMKFLSHEVKGHLTKSKAAFAGIIEGDFGPVTPHLNTIAHAALADTEQGVKTVMSILDGANLEIGEVPIDKKEFDLAACVRRLVQEFQPQASAKQLSLVSSIEDPCVIVGDEQKIERNVLRNFLDNAIRYTKVGQVDIVLEKINGFARISVSDTGVGINANDMVKLFTQGGHGEHSREVNPESTGYGLFVAKKIVEKHGGRIWARSAGPGAGSTFFAEFPLTR